MKQNNSRDMIVVKGFGIKEAFVVKLKETKAYFIDSKGVRYPKSKDVKNGIVATSSSSGFSVCQVYEMGNEYAEKILDKSLASVYLKELSGHVEGMSHNDVIALKDMLDKLKQAKSLA